MKVVNESTVFGSKWKSNEVDDDSDEESDDSSNDNTLKDDDDSDIDGDSRLEQIRDTTLVKRKSSPLSVLIEPLLLSYVTHKVVLFSDIIKNRVVSDSTTNKNLLKQRVRKAKRNLQELPIGQWRAVLINRSKLQIELRNKIKAAKEAIEIKNAEKL